MTEATETMATATGWRGQSDDPSEHITNAGAGGKYRTGGSETEESLDKSAEWGGEDTEESASKEEAVTAMGEREAGRLMTATVEATEESKEDGRPGGAAAGGDDVGEATSAATENAGAGGPPWGENCGKEEDRWKAGKSGWRVLRSGRPRGGPQGLRRGDQSLRREGRRRRSRGLWSVGKPWGGLPGSGRGSRVAIGNQHPWSGRIALGGRNPRSGHCRRWSAGGGRTGAGRGRNPPNHPSNRGERIQRRRQSEDGQAEDGGTAAPTAGNGGGHQ